MRDVRVRWRSRSSLWARPRRIETRILEVGKEQLDDGDASSDRAQVAVVATDHTVEKDHLFGRLEGAHVATPCFACHLDEAEDRWTFRQIGETCVDCHENIHKDYISDSYYPEEDCRACHSSEAWDDIAFDHDLTGWVLDGKHAEIACRECHYEAQEGLESYLQVFQGLEGECVSCHENVHGDEFAVNGVTVCTECHVTTSWVPELFDHDQTRFPLEGRHAEIDCAACHEIESEEGTPTIVYKLNKLQCIDCHQ